MTILFLLALILVAFLILEFIARCIYYSRKKEFSFAQVVKMVFLGRWLIDEYAESSLYLEEIAGSLGVDKEYMIMVLARSSGKPAEEIRSLFLGKSGGNERYDLNLPLGFLPRPLQNLNHMHTNRWGFRSPERQQKKGHGVKRVLLLGGSVAYGRTATSNEATIAYQLEDLLNQDESRKSDTRWEVINMAVPDFISYQELNYLIRTGLPFEPDVVVSLSGYNDPHHYLATGTVNEPASLQNVRNTYNAFFGNSIQRLRAFLGTFFVTVQFAGSILKGTDPGEDEELSPFIYTIW